MSQATAYKLLREISESDEDLVYRIMGDFGLGLKRFVGAADLTHPELNALFEEFYTEDGLFLDRCFEFVKTIKYANQNGFSSSAGVFEEKLNSFFRGKLLNKMSNIRLLKSSSQRREMRSLKKYKAINLDYLFSSEFWHDYPECFDYYERNSLLYEQKVSDLLSKKDTYLSLGFYSLAEEADKDINEIKRSAESHYGFHQIKSTTASVILARMLGFYFDKHGIFVEGKLKYCPFICPVEDILYDVPPVIKDKIACLEGLPEADGKPIFDVFALIVPTCCGAVKIPDKDQKEALRFFVKNKVFKSVLVGEKSNKLYFIDLVS